MLATFVEPGPASLCSDQVDGIVGIHTYTPEIRRVIYTTIFIEGFHRQLRKATKTKGAFTSDEALMKLLYLI